MLFRWDISYLGMPFLGVLLIYGTLNAHIEHLGQSKCISKVPASQEIGFLNLTSKLVSFSIRIEVVLYEA